MWTEQTNWTSPRKSAPLAPQASITSIARSISDEEEHAGLTQQLELLKDFSRQLGQKVIERDGQLAGTTCKCIIQMMCLSCPAEHAETYNSSSLSSAIHQALSAPGYSLQHILNLEKASGCLAN